MRSPAGVAASKYTVRESAEWTRTDDSTGGTIDTVLVAQGIYDELIDFHGKTLALVSERGALRTTIDGQGGGTVITMQSGEGPGTLVEGFTITGGATSFGAGMYLEGTAPTVRNKSDW